jgi:hypothetical protein
VKRHRLVLLAVSLAAVTPVAAQRSAAPTIVLDKGATEFADPFSQLAPVVEMRDRRVLTVDLKEKEFRVVDFARGSATPVSRAGSGPLEYQLPGFLLRGAADTALFYDAMQRRLLFISPAAAPVRTMPFGGTDPAAMISQMVPAWTDAVGRMYGTTSGLVMPAAGGTPAPTFSDTVDIQVFDPRVGRAESLARIRSLISQSKPKMEMGPQGVRMTMVAPDFRATDAWTAMPDGRVAILRDGVYRVHFISPGRPETLGPTVAYEPVAVTATERRSIVDSMRTAMDRSLNTARSAAAQAAPGRNITIDVEVLEPQSWAVSKPAYAGIIASPEGRLWVAKPVSADTKYARFDVLDGTGALVAHVQLAPGESFIGLGRGTVYTIRTDGDDLQYLRRYALPAPLG